jgi:hypothetical protein
METFKEQMTILSMVSGNKLTQIKKVERLILNVIHDRELCQTLFSVNLHQKMRRLYFYI